MDWQERISLDPEVLAGKPVIKGTRIAVELIVELLAEGWAQEAVLRNYPQLRPEDIRAALRYTADVAKRERHP